METTDAKDADQRSKDDVRGHRIANMLPEMVAFLLAFGNVFEKATLNQYFIYSSCEEFHPFEVDCGIDSQDDTNVQVYKTFRADALRFVLRKQQWHLLAPRPPIKSKKMAAEGGLSRYHVSYPVLNL